MSMHVTFANFVCLFVCLFVFCVLLYLTVAILSLTNKVA